MSPEQILLQEIARNNQAISALQQPAPQQGGFLANADPVMLSLAAGLLSPTKTGGFGESIAQGISSASGPLSDIRRQEAARADKLSALQSAQAKLAMDLYEIKTGKRSGRSDDPSLVSFRYKGIAQKALEAANLVGEEDPRYKGLMEEYDYYNKLAKSASQGAVPPKKKDGDVEGGDAVEAAGDATGDADAGSTDEGAFPKITTQEQYDALPSGTVYIHPDTGKPKIKP
jgi:hypothetical protein